MYGVGEKLHDQGERRWDGEGTTDASESTKDEKCNLLMGESTDEMGQAKDESASDECRLGSIDI